MNALGLGGGFGREQGQLHPAQLHFSLLHLLGLRGDLHAQLGRSLIHQINGRIGQAAVRDVAGRKPRRRQQGRIGDRDAVVEFVALLQAPEDLDTGVKAWLPDQHLLKTAIKTRVLFDAAAIVLGSGGTDAAQVTASQGGLENAARIGAGAITGDDGVQFIDEQHHAARAARRVGLAHLLKHAAQPLFKLPPKFGAGDQGPQVKGHQPQPLQRFGHLTTHNPLGQQLGHSGFSHTGLADQHRIVLAAAGEHLHESANLAIATDHRIKLAGAGRRREIAAVALQGGGLWCLRFQHKGLGRADRPWARR